MQALSVEWNQLPQDDRKAYPVAGTTDHSQSAGELISSREEDSKRRRRQLWKNMKQQVFNLNMGQHLHKSAICWIYMESLR
jgi:hypothetical protein